MSLKLLFKELNSEATHAMKGKTLYLRVPILSYLLFIFVMHLRSFNYVDYLLYPLNMGTYELGSFVFAWWGKFMGVLGGLGFQLCAPILAIFNFYFLGDFFAIFFSFGWLSTSFFLVSRCVVEAGAMGVPFYGVFSQRNLSLDWHYFLTQTGLLSYSGSIAFASNVLATVAMIICLTGGTWLLIKVKKSGAHG